MMSDKTEELFGKLMNWCHEFSEGTQPEPVLEFAGYAESIAIGSIVVWDSENGYADEQDDGPVDHPSAERCIECYKRLMAQLTAWPPSGKEGS